MGGGNQLETIDLSSNPNLQFVRLENNLLTEMDIRNGNNTNIGQFDTTGNFSLECIFVDDAEYMEDHWGNAIDENSHFVETQAACDAIGVLEEEFFKDISIYPNPGLGIIFVENKSQITNNKVQISVRNILGKQLMQYHILPDQIDISQYPSGIYFITLQSNQQKIVYKIVKLTY